MNKQLIGLIDADMDVYDYEWKSVRHILLLLSFVIRISVSDIGCKMPRPKELHVEECDCHHNGSDAYLTCYSDVECYDTSDNTIIYLPRWIEYEENGSRYNLSSDPRYQNDIRTVKRGIDTTRFVATLIISNVTDADFIRRFKFYILSEYDDLQQLPPIPLCNKTERTLDVDEPVDHTAIIICFAIVVPVCVIIVSCAVINVPFMKYFYFKCCRKKILHKRKGTIGLTYDTALLYDTDDTIASLIAVSLKNKLSSRGLDVASAGDVSGDQPQLRELYAIPISATVIYIVTEGSTIDRLLTLARDEASTSKTSNQQILVYTYKVPPEFKQYKLLTLCWFEDRAKIYSGHEERYRVVSTVNINRGVGEPNGDTNVNEESNPNINGNMEEDNVNFMVRLYRKWRRQKFYMALKLGLSTGFRVNNAATYNTSDVSKNAVN